MLKAVHKSTEHTYKFVLIIFFHHHITDQFVSLCVRDEWKIFNEEKQNQNQNQDLKK